MTCSVLSRLFARVFRHTTADAFSRGSRVSTVLARPLALSRLGSHRTHRPGAGGPSPPAACAPRTSPVHLHLRVSHSLVKLLFITGAPFPQRPQVWGGKTEQRSTVSSGIQLPARPAASSLGSKTGDTAAIAVLLRLQVYQLSQKQRHELLVDLERDDGHRDDRHDDERGAAAREGGRRHGHRAGRVPLLPRHRRGDDPEEREDAKGAWLGVGVGVGVGSGLGFRVRVRVRVQVRVQVRVRGPWSVVSGEGEDEG